MLFLLLVFGWIDSLRQVKAPPLLTLDIWLDNFVNILYILKAFPNLTETFIYDEIRELSLNNNISIFSINKPGGGHVYNDRIDKQVIKDLCYLQFSSREGRENFSMFSIFKKGIEKSLLCSFLNMVQKIRLFRYCYNEIQGKELSLRMFLDSLDIIEYIKDNNITHIHCHFAERNVMMAYAINSAIAIPYTFTMHGGDVYYYPPGNLKELAISSRKLITVCDYNKQFLIDNFNIPIDKIEVISCGINLEKFKPIHVEKENKLTILTVGRLITIKGHKYLIEACKILKDMGVEFQCWIVGYGPEKENLLKQIDDLMLKEYILLLGAKDYNELIELYNKSDIFVLPSLSEASPTVLKESLACQTPVIATNISGIPEIVENGKNGMLVEPKEPEQIAENIIVMSNNELRYKFKNNARDVIDKKYNIIKNVAKLNDVFQYQQNI